MNVFDGINWWAIVVSVVVSMVLGYAWYSMALFGRSWMNLIGKQEADLKKGAGAAMGGTVILSFLYTLTIAYIFEHSTIDYSLQNGLMFGLMVAIGIALPIMLNNVLYEGRPMKLFWINYGYQFVWTVILGMIIGGWQLA